MPGCRPCQATDGLAHAGLLPMRPMTTKQNMHDQFTGGSQHICATPAARQCSAPTANCTSPVGHCRSVSAHLQPLLMLQDATFNKAPPLTSTLLPSPPARTNMLLHMQTSGHKINYPTQQQRPCMRCPQRRIPWRWCCCQLAAAALSACYPFSATKPPMTQSD